LPDFRCRLRLSKWSSRSLRLISTSKITLTTPFTCDGSRMLPLRIGEQSPAAKHKTQSAGSCCATRLTTRRRPRSATKPCFGHGLARPLGSPSNGSPKSGARAMAISCPKHARSGVPSILKLAGQCASQRKCAHNFPPELSYILRTFAFSIFLTSLPHCVLLQNRTLSVVASGRLSLLSARNFLLFWILD
jgi:hypothetical protein